MGGEELITSSPIPIKITIMIKNKLTQLVLILAFPFIYAQTTATTNLKVTLNPLMSISVSTPEVAIDVSTEAEYIDGTDVLINDHISTFSTSSFEVNVKTLAGNLSGNTGSIEALMLGLMHQGLMGLFTLEQCSQNLGRL